MIASMKSSSSINGKALSKITNRNPNPNKRKGINTNIRKKAPTSFKNKSNTFGKFLTFHYFYNDLSIPWAIKFGKEYTLPCS